MTTGRILFYDSSASGHHGEFLENILYGISSEVDSELFILAHPDLSSRLLDAKADSGCGTKLYFLAEAQVDAIEHSLNVRQQGRIELDLVEQFCERHRIHLVILMHMNMYQLELSYRFRSSEYQIRGIMLDHCTPIDRTFGLASKLQALFTGIRKRLQYRLMLCNRNVERVFLLNDSVVATQLNSSYRRRSPFRCLPDPLPILATNGGAAIRVEGGKHLNGRYTFLCVGSMAPRKGCLEILDALSKLDVSILSRIELRFVGRFDAAYRKLVEQMVGALLQVAPELQIHIEDRFVSFKEMSEEFNFADCILAPYIGFMGSSGIIGHACMHRRPLIACREGLLGELVLQLGLGGVVNPRDASAFAGVLKRAVQGGLELDRSAAEGYVAQASSISFGRALIEGWGNIEVDD